MRAALLLTRAQTFRLLSSQATPWLALTVSAISDSALLAEANVESGSEDDISPGKRA